MQIIGKKVLLRAIEEDDLMLLHRWANDPETQDNSGNIHFPSSMDFHKQWFSRLKDDHLNQRYAIDVDGLGLIGYSSILNINWRHNRAHHGVYIGNTEGRGKGYAFDAVITTMRYAFDELHFERLDGDIIEYHHASYDFYCGKLNWKEEGRRRNYYYRKGRYWDQIVVGVTREDYLDLLKRTNYWET